MAAIHPAYMMVKIPGPKGPITLYVDPVSAARCDCKTLDLVSHFQRDEHLKEAKQQKLDTTEGSKKTPCTPKMKLLPVPPAPIPQIPLLGQPSVSAPNVATSSGKPAAPQEPAVKPKAYDSDTPKGLDGLKNEKQEEATATLEST